MAIDLRLTDGDITIDFETETGIKLQSQYLPSFATPTGDGTIPPSLTETLPVYIYIADDDDLASTLQNVGTLSDRAALYDKDNHQTPIWFYRQMTAESGGTRALVSSFSFIPDVTFGGILDDPPASCQGRTGFLTITHHPYNERTTAVAASGTNGVSVIGGAANYTDIVGDVPARMYYVHVDNLAAARIYRRFWIGFRSDRRAGGDAGNVASLWECELGILGASTALAGDGTASPGGGGNTKMRCNFVNPAWASRSDIPMSAITANYANQVGAFVVILRAKVDADAAQVRLRSGNNTSVVYRQGPVVEVADTAWNLYVMGTVEFPTRNLHAVPTALFAATFDRTDRLDIWARLAPGAVATNLDMDCLILIPADEYFVQVQSAEIAGTDDELYVLVAPEDVGQGLNIDGVSNWIGITCPTSFLGSGIPVGDGRVFICVANDNEGTAPAFGDTVDVEVSSFPRWIYFRGAE